MAWALLLALTDLSRAAPPAEARVRVLIKVLSYDRALVTRQDNDELVIGVVWDPEDAVAASQGAEVLAALRGLRGWTVGGLRLVEPRGMPLGRTELGVGLTNVAAVIACGAVADDLTVAADHADRPVLSLDAERGAAVGLAQRQARLRILLDRVRAEAQGMDPSGELYEVAEVVGP